jgi:hypothetical protein
VLDHGLAADQRQRFAGEARREIPRGNNGDNRTGLNGIWEPCWQNNGHDKS